MRRQHSSLLSPSSTSVRRGATTAAVTATASSARRERHFAPSGDRGEPRARGRAICIFIKRPGGLHTVDATRLSHPFLRTYTEMHFCHRRRCVVRRRHSRPHESARGSGRFIDVGGQGKGEGGKRREEKRRGRRVACRRCARTPGDAAGTKLPSLSLTSEI